MSKPKIDKEEVAAAMEALKKAGKNLTAPAVRAACGGKGSFATILKYMTELADAETAANDSPQALESFRSIWKVAVQEGRAQRDEEIRNSLETIQAMSAEISTLEGEATSCRSTAAEATKKCDDALAKLTTLNEGLAQARAASERNATKLVETIEKHNLDDKKLREELAQAKDKVHELELQLARVETKLEDSIETKAKAK
jgi:chromosome segregation ATPase